MVQHWLVVFLLTLAASSPQARRVNEANFKRLSPSFESSGTELASSSFPGWVNALNEEAEGEEGGGREKQDEGGSAAVGEGCQPGDVSGGLECGSSKIAECLTKPFKKLAQKLQGPTLLLVDDLVGVLHDISKKGGGLEQCGFANAAKELLLNVRKLSACPAGYTVDQCLQDETTRVKKDSRRERSDLANTLAHDDKPAILEDPSPAIGFLWCMRILGFIGEMFNQVGRGDNLVDAGAQAYASRIAPAFHWWSPVALVVKKTMLPFFSEKTIMAKVGGEEAGANKLSESVKADMAEFSEVVLPLVSSIWDIITALKLDDSPIK